jgi:hypothetical protein
MGRIVERLHAGIGFGSRRRELAENFTAPFLAVRRGKFQAGFPSGGWATVALFAVPCLTLLSNSQ